MLRLGKMRHALIGLFERMPWLGWGCWVIFCVIALARTTPRRFGSTFEVYLDYAHRFFTQQQLYDPSTLGAFLYWPISLVILRPFLSIALIPAAMVALFLSALLMSYAAIKLVQALLPLETRRAVMLAGVLLLINIPACWFNFKYIQAQIGMTAGMMLAAAAMMRARFPLASLWLFISAVIKPLSIVMILLSLVLQPRMRLGLIAALLAGLALPFLFADANYVVLQYREWILKLSTLSSAQPADWPYQADFATLLDTLRIPLSGPVATAIRLIAAVGTLFLAWRISKIESRVIFPLALLLLSGCYITLFGPRNEFLSFLVLTPGLTALALSLFMRDNADKRGWLLVGAALLLGFSYGFAVDRAIKPAIVLFAYIWLIWLTLKPQRWRELLPQ